MIREYRMWMDKICLKFNTPQNALFFVIRCYIFNSPIFYHSLSDIRYSLFKNFLPVPSTYYLLPTTYYLLRNEHIT
jgi:hypothetical protein